MPNFLTLTARMNAPSLGCLNILAYFYLSTHFLQSVLLGITILEDNQVLLIMVFLGSCKWHIVNVQEISNKLKVGKHE